MKKLWLSSFFILIACQTIERTPAGQQENSAIIREELRLQLLRQELEVLSQRNRNRNNDVPDATGLNAQILKLQTELQNRTIALDTMKQTREQQFAKDTVKAPKALSTVFSDRWRTSFEDITLPPGESFLPNNTGAFKTFFLNDLEAKSITVNLRHWLLTGNRPENKRSRQDAFYEAQVQCQVPYKLRLDSGTKSADANEITKFRWFDFSYPSDVTLALPAVFTQCQVRFGKPGEKTQHGFNLEPESKLMSHFGFVQEPTYQCLLPRTESADPLQQLFLSKDSSNFSCPQKVAHLRPIETGTESINAKVKALLGRELTQQEREGNDPFFPLDTATLPKLDVIFISALDFRADFFGTVLRRLLEMQAHRGAQVRIISSGPTSEPGDHWRQWESAAREPNLKNVWYNYRSQNITGMDQVAPRHRSMHTKMFLTYSHSFPELNAFITGGRNLTDLYSFQLPKDVSKTPTVSIYDPKKWFHFEDYEVEVKEPVVVQQLMAQYLTLYNLDQSTMTSRPFNVNFTSSELAPNYFQLAPNEHLIRHFMSFPMRGDLSLESFFVRAIDSAQRSIRIISPYLNPTVRVGEAISRAVARGVKVEAIISLNLENDTSGPSILEVNKTAANKYMKKIKMFSFDEQKTVLHAKVLIVDDRLSLVGSVNLNQRSFYHDTENILAIYSPDFSKEASRFFETYKGKSMLLTEKLKAVYWRKILTNMVKEEY